MPLQPKPPTLPTVRELESLPPRGLYWVTMVPKGPNWRRIIIISSIVAVLLAAAGFGAFAAFAAFAADSSDSSSTTSTASVEITYQPIEATKDENVDPSSVSIDNSNTANQDSASSQSCEDACSSTTYSTCVAYFYDAGTPNCNLYSSIALVSGGGDTYMIKYINGSPSPLVTITDNGR